MEQQQDRSLAGLMDFIERSPGSYHAVHELTRRMDEAGFTALSEAETWTLQPGGCYYVVRSGASVISFKLPRRPARSMHLIASHSDSPTFKLKPGGPILTPGAPARLNVEPYGGMLRQTWFDRPLSIAGRVLVQEGEHLRQALVYFDRDLVMIPSLAIHLKRDLPQQNTPPSVQNEMLPLFGENAQALPQMIAEAAQAQPEQILGADLFLTCREKPTLWGADNEFLSAPRLDDLACCYASFEGFLAAVPDEHISLHCVFDNEEVGSRSEHGAESTFLRDTALRIALGLGLSRDEFHAMLARSFLVSADNAHAFHPAYPERYDPMNRPQMNGGPVLKHQAGQKYTTDAVSEAIFKLVCKRCDVPMQEYTNRSDVPGGSTLGNISNTQLSLRSVDIGLAQLAMHSAYETMGSRDCALLARFSECFYRDALPEVALV